MQTTCVVLLLAIGVSAPRAPAVDDAPPKGVDPAMTSQDPDFGRTKKKPVTLGDADVTRAPLAERTYLKQLRDSQGKPVAFTRRGSVGGGEDKHVLDLYDVTTSTGQTFEIYIDMYHAKESPAKQKAIKGLFKAIEKK